VGELERRQHAVVVQPAEQNAVPGGQLRLDPKDGIVDEVSPPSDADAVPTGRPEDLQGLSEDMASAVTDGTTCGVSGRQGAVRGSG
jgi:hypothetical protein